MPMKLILVYQGCMKMNRSTFPRIAWRRTLCVLFLASFGCVASARQEPTIFSTFPDKYLVPTPKENASCSLVSDTTYNCLYDKPIQLFESPCLALITSFSTLFDLVMNVSEQVPLRRAFMIGSYNESMQGGNTVRLDVNNSGLLPDPSFSVDIDIRNLSVAKPTAQVGISCNRLNIWSGEFSLEFGEGRRGNFLDLVVWVEYEGSSQVLNITMVSTLSESYFLAVKPRTPLISLEYDLARCFQKKSLFVGMSLDAHTSFVRRMNGTSPNAHRARTGPSNWKAPPVWTFNSDGPAPDQPRDIYGSPYVPTETKTQLVSTELVVGITVPGGIIFISLTYIIYVLHRRNSRLNALARTYDVRGIDDFHGGPQSFTRQTLSAATKGFSCSQFVGKGGFGSVYKGKLHLRGSQNQVNVAVKRISATSSQGAREFLNEVKIVGQVRHRNLVPLLGWCHKKDELLLVYEYMPNGSLDQHLFSVKGEDGNDHPVLTWARRLKILSGVGTAVAYLHEDWEQRVIHRDIKSSNVMLDSDFNGRLRDFGLAKLSAHGHAPASTQVLAGTYGYLAPELGQTLKATEKTDVYSFGVLILEVATGKSPVLVVDELRNPEDHLFLVDWVWSLYGNENILDAADVRLENAFDRAEMVSLLQIGLLCCHPDAMKRPTMREVLNIWRGAVALPDLPLTKPVPVFVATATTCTGVHNLGNVNLENGDDKVTSILAEDHLEAFKTPRSYVWTLRSTSGWRLTPLPI